MPETCCPTHVHCNADLAIQSNPLSSDGRSEPVCLPESERSHNTLLWYIWCVCLELSPLDRYVHSSRLCSTLALLVSQGTMTEFLQRISLLIKLQKCWTNGHSDIKLHCSLDDDSCDELCHLSPEEFTSDSNLLRPINEAQSGSTCNSGGDCWKLFCKGYSKWSVSELKCEPLWACFPVEMWECNR